MEEVSKWLAIIGLTLLFLSFVLMMFDYQEKEIQLTVAEQVDAMCQKWIKIGSLEDKALDGLIPSTERTMDNSCKVQILTC